MSIVHSEIFDPALGGYMGENNGSDVEEDGGECSMAVDGTEAEKKLYTKYVFISCVCSSLCHIIFSRNESTYFRIFIINSFK